MILKNPLSDLDKVKAEEALKKETLNYVMKHKKAHYFRNTMVLACACVLCFFFFRVLQPRTNIIPTETSQVYAYVTLDINPSVELRLDRENQVIETKAYNADGEALLKQVSLLHKSLEECVVILTSNEQFQSYMKDGYLQVSVYSEDETHSQALENQLDEELKMHFTEEQYSCSCASKNDHEQAGMHHMSFGRYQMIEMIMELDASYQMEKLQTKSMKELKELYEQISGNEVDETKGLHHGSHHNN